MARPKPDDPVDVAFHVRTTRAEADALAAGEDATRRLPLRVLSRAEARRKLREAEARIEALFVISRGAPNEVPMS